MKTKRLAIPVLVATILGVGAIGLRAQGPKADPEHPFAGKIVQFHYKSDANHSALMRDVEFRTLAGRPFVVGVDVEVDGYANGLEEWVAMDDISTISVFPSVEEQARRHAKWWADQAKKASPFDTTAPRSPFNPDPSAASPSPAPRP